jgi:hypothetical protein
MMMRPRASALATLAVSLGAGCVGTELSKVVAQRDAIGAAADDYSCPKHKIREISDNADNRTRHWIYILSVCGIPRAYQDQAGQGGFNFVEIALPADAGPAPLKLPPRAPEDDEDEPQATAPRGAEPTDAAVPVVDAAADR